MKKHNLSFKKIYASLISATMVLGMLPEAVLAKEEIFQEVNPNEFGSFDQIEKQSAKNVALPEEGIEIKIPEMNDSGNPGNSEYQHVVTKKFISSIEIPEDAIENEDGSYTWTELETDVTGDLLEEEIPDVSGLRPDSVSEPKYIYDENGRIIAEEITYTFSLDDNGTTYTVTHRIHWVYDENNERIPEEHLEPDTTKPLRPENESDRTPNHTTSYVENIYTITPGTVTVKMNTEKTAARLAAHSSALPKITGSTVLLKNGVNGKYNANIDLHLSDPIVSTSDSITVQIQHHNGTTENHEVQITDKTDYTLPNIELADGEKFTLKLIDEESEGGSTGTPADPDEIAGNKEWAADFLYSDGKTGLGDAGWYGIFAKTYTADPGYWGANGVFHSNANIAVETLNFNSLNQIVGIGDHITHNNGSAGTSALDYSYRDLSYIGSFSESGRIHIEGNTNAQLLPHGSYLILGGGFEIGQNQSNSNTPVIDVQSGSTTVTVDSNKPIHILNAIQPINFDRALTQLNSYAVNLKAQADTLPVDESNKNVNGTIRINCASKTRNADGYKVVSLDINDLCNTTMNGGHGMHFIFDGMNESSDKVLVNVTGLEKLNSKEALTFTANIRPNNNQNEWSANNANILFNFGDYAGTLDFTGTTWLGSVLAPKAHVKICSSGATFNGKVMADSVTRGANEQHVTGPNWNPGGETKPQRETSMEMEIAVVAATHSSTSNKGPILFTDYTQAFYKKKDPEKPEEPGNPDTPGNPENPDKPENPDTPDTPENPDKPGKPENPDTPGTPDKPENPGTPDKPENSDQPENPDKPENPDDSDDSEDDDDSETPDTPDKPDSSKPEEPEHPEGSDDIPIPDPTPEQVKPNTSTTPPQSQVTEQKPSTNTTGSNEGSLNVADTSTKQAASVHTAAMTGVWSSIGVMTVSGGVGILSLFGIKSRKKRK